MACRLTILRCLTSKAVETTACREVFSRRQENAKAAEAKSVWGSRAMQSVPASNPNGFKSANEAGTAIHQESTMQKRNLEKYAGKSHEDPGLPSDLAKENSGDKNHHPFLTDVQHLRAQARSSIERGAITPAYKGDVKVTIEILQSVLATEIVCVLRYSMNAVSAAGIASNAVKEEFDEHAKEEFEHMMAAAERINQLGGVPNFSPDGLAMRSASQYVEAGNLVEMIKENLVAERIACEHYRELVRFFSDRDPTTRTLMERLLAKEEEHANDMHDLLIGHQGTPMLPN